MKYTASFILGLVGSILGLMGSLLWILFGSSFWGHFLGGALGMDTYALSDSFMGMGFLVATCQSLVTIAFFIIALLKSLPKNLEINPRKNGFWLLWIGIGVAVFNLFHLIPCILLIISGVLILGETRHETKMEL